MAPCVLTPVSAKVCGAWRPRAGADSRGDGALLGLTGGPLFTRRPLCESSSFDVHPSDHSCRPSWSSPPATPGVRALPGAIPDQRPMCGQSSRGQSKAVGTDSVSSSTSWCATETSPGNQSFGVRGAPRWQKGSSTAGLLGQGQGRVTGATPSQAQFPAVAQTLPHGQPGLPSLPTSHLPGLGPGCGRQLHRTQLGFRRPGRPFRGAAVWGPFGHQEPLWLAKLYLSPGQLSQEFPFLVSNRSQAAVLLVLVSLLLSPLSSLVFVVTLAATRKSRGQCVGTESAAQPPGFKPRFCLSFAVWL